jgi:translation elongation factor EF-Ts
MNPKDVKDLLAQSYIRDPKKKIDDLVKETAAKVKEKIEVSQIVRLSL